MGELIWKISKSLQGELARANVAEGRNSLSQLIDAQLNVRTFASVRKEYAFKVVDPTVVTDADNQTRPARTLLVVLDTFLSMLLAFSCNVCSTQSSRDSRTNRARIEAELMTLVTQHQVDRGLINEFCHALQI